MDNFADPIRVLVVDDEQDIRDGSERILSRIGYDVNKSPRGDEALKILPQINPSIVLLDLMMPGMGGMEVLKHIREIDDTIQVIVITGYATVEAAIEAMKEGAYDFIPKPFEPDQLRIVVNRASEKIRLTREAHHLAQEKSRTLMDLDTEKSRTRTILNSLPDSLLVTNTQGQVVLMNPAFRQTLGLDPDFKPGRDIDEYIPDKALCQLVKDISAGKYIDFDDIPDQEFALSNEKYLLARAQPVLGERRECLGAVVNMVDVTAMKVLDRLKSEFVAKVSHELRSPLSTIHEQLALVIKDLVAVAPQQDQHLLSRAKEKTQGLISTIGDLLDLSRIEEGAICHAPEPTQLEDTLQNIVSFMESRAQAKGQSLALHLPEQKLPTITADPLALESIFGNLIANAMNYSGEGAQIEVIVNLAGINARVQVKDNGFGIEERHLSKIFDRFYRVQNEKTRYITGTGLGLPIVKGLVDTMGGMIDVESELGKGTVFTVLLPVS